MTRWRTRSAVAPWMTSERKRWPCVDIAMRSTLLFVGGADQLLGGIAERQLRADGEALRGEIRLEALEVRAVRFHLLRLAQLQLIEVARRPAVGDVHEQQLGAGELRERR